MVCHKDTYDILHSFFFVSRSISTSQAVFCETYVGLMQNIIEGNLNQLNEAQKINLPLYDLFSDILM